MSTATMPRRIGTLQYLRAAVAVRLGIEPEHEGATPEWAELLRNGIDEQPAVSRVEETPTVVIEPVRRTPQRRPVALAAVPYELVDVPHLGVLPIGPQEPALLFDATRYELIGVREQVLAKMREQLGDPATAVAEIFTAAGCAPATDDLSGGDR